MAIATSSECSIASINNCRKHHNITSITTCKTLCFLSYPFSKFPNFSSLNSSVYPSPILQDESATLPILDLDPKRQKASKKFSVENVHNSNMFLCGLLRDPSKEEMAFEYYEKAKENPEFKPQKSTLKHLIRYLVRSKKWDLLLSLSNDFKNYDVYPDTYTCSKLISDCIRARKFKIVETLLGVFESDSKAVVWAFGSALKGYNKLHMFRNTILLFNRMKSAGVVLDLGCYFYIMEAYHKINDTENVVSLFHEFENRKLDFNSLTPRIYGILCDSLGKSGRAFEALDYFQDMKTKGVAEDSSIYSSLISSFVRLREVKMAETLFKEAEGKKMLRDPEIFLKFVLMYIDEGLLDRTLEVVNSMKDAGVKVSDCILCSIVNGFSKAKGFQAAIKVYEHLISQGCEPGQVTYASIINAYSRIGLYAKAENIFLEMEEKGFDKCVVAYSSMIAMYGKTGNLRYAMRLLGKMKQKGCRPNVWIYNSLIDMHGRANDLRQVEKLWKEMERRKIAPDKVSYTSVISAYNKGREFEMCTKYYQEFRLNGGAIDRAMGGIMVGVFSKTSRIDELVKLLQDMKSEGTKLDGRLFHSALNALRDAGLQVQVRWLHENFETT